MITSEKLIRDVEWEYQSSQKTLDSNDYSIAQLANQNLMNQSFNSNEIKSATIAEPGKEFEIIQDVFEKYVLSEEKKSQKRFEEKSNLKEANKVDDVKLKKIEINENAREKILEEQKNNEIEEFFKMITNKIKRIKRPGNSDLKEDREGDDVKLKKIEMDDKILKKSIDEALNKIKNIKEAINKVKCTQRPKDTERNFKETEEKVVEKFVKFNCNFYKQLIAAELQSKTKNYIKLSFCSEIVEKVMKIAKFVWNFLYGIATHSVEFAKCTVKSLNVGFFNLCVAVEKISITIFQININYG